MLVVCHGLSARRPVVLGHRQRDLEVAPLVGSLEKPRELLPAKHLETELGRVALANVVHDVDVEVGIPAGLVDAFGRRSYQPLRGRRGRDPRDMTLAHLNGRSQADHG